MSEHGTKEQSTTTIFDAAGKVAKVLEGHAKDDQQRILRLVVEGLSLADVLPKSRDSAARGGEAPSQEAPSAATPTDIKTFVHQKQPKSDVQFAAVAAYFYRFVAGAAERKDAIGREDLQEAARLAQWKRFPKPYTPLQNAAIQGYLDRAGGGTFRINAVGENLVAMALPGGGQENASAGGRGKARAKKAPKRAKNKRGRSPNSK